MSETAIQIAICGSAGDGTIALAGTTAHVPSANAEKIVDTTSAGDSFNGSFLARYVATGDAVAAARFAADVAASVIQHHGALVAREELPG